MNQWIDPIFNMLKVKFDVLDQLNVLDRTKEQVMVFINLEDPFRYLLNQRNDVQLKAAQCSIADIQLNLISNVINLGQHYRLYCKKNKKSSRVFLYWNYPKGSYNNRIYWSKYRDDFDKRFGINTNAEYVTRCIEQMVPILNSIIPFINQVYLVSGGPVESSLIPKIVMPAYDDGVPKQCIIVSRSRYDYQYLYDDFTIIEPRGANSCIVDNTNVIDHMKQKKNIKNPMTVPSSLLSFILALLGDEHRGIPKIEGFGLLSIIKAIHTALEHHFISETTQDIDLLSSILNETYRSRFERNYHMVNLELQMEDVTPVQAEMITSQLIDKYDDRTLNAMNERYFLRDPIMLVDTASEQAFRQGRISANPFQ